MVFAAPVISTFCAAGAYAAASNPIHAGSPFGAGGCKNVGFSCTTNSDCCGQGTDLTACQATTCCVKSNKNGCLIDQDCCDFPTDTCNAGICN